MTLFVLPFALAAAPFEVVMWRTGESWPVTRALAAQREAAREGEELLWDRRLFSQQFNVYKLAGIAAGDPEVLVVGSSRVMQFRAEHVSPLSFYNAGGLLQGYADLTKLLDMLSSGQLPMPEVLVIGLDPWWFTSGEPGPPSWLVPARLTDAAFDPSAHLRALVAIPGDARPLDAVLGSESTPTSGGLGLNAMRGNGFRADGSRRYGGYLLEFACHPRYRDRESPPVLERIRQGSRQFAVGAGFDRDRWSTALATMRALPTEVVVFVPPVSTEAARALRASPPHARWWEHYLEAARSAAGVQAVVIESPETVGLDDRYMLDGFHPSEVLIGMAVAEMQERAPAASPLRRVRSRWTHSSGVASAWTPLAYETPADLPDCQAE